LRFWDSSAIVPLIVAEDQTAEMKELAKADPLMCVWWATETECASALAGLERDEALTDDTARAALQRLDELAHAWIEVQPIAPLRPTARRLLRVHTLRAADALQLAAAIAAAEGVPASLDFVTLDQQLAAAAGREGFAVVGA